MVNVSSGVRGCGKAGDRDLSCEKEKKTGRRRDDLGEPVTQDAAKAYFFSSYRRGALTGLLPQVHTSAK